MYDTSGWGASDGGAIGSPGTVKKKEKEKKLAALTGVSHYHPLLGESRETMLQRALMHVNKVLLRSRVRHPIWRSTHLGAEFTTRLLYMMSCSRALRSKSRFQTGNANPAQQARIYCRK